MLPEGYSLLERLDTEVSEIGPADSEEVRDARHLLRDLVQASVRYTRLVSPTTLGSRAPEGDYPAERETWRREIEAADRARRQAHNVVIDAYNALTRYCRKFRKRELSVEVTFPPGSPRAKIGDLAAKIFNGIAHAEALDGELHRRLTR